MNSQSGFDPGLLARPWEERLSYFLSYVAAHKKLNDITARIKEVVRRQNDINLVFLVGPSGVGKTTAQTHIVASLLDEFLPEMEADPGIIPVAGVEAGAYASSYNWKDHWFGCLDSVQEPLIEHKAAIHDKRFHVTGTRRISDDMRGSSIRWRRAFVSAARERRLCAFFVDEAHHLTNTTKPQLLNHAEVMKSVASQTGAVHVLGGTYKLLELRNLSGQLGRRSLTIDFGRYRPDAPEDLLAFAGVVLDLQAHMPLVEVPDLRPHLDYCFETSLGCVGLLKTWFERALQSVLRNDGRTLSRADLERHEHPEDVRLDIAREIYNNEQKLIQNESKLSDIRMFLGVTPQKSKSHVGSTAPVASASSSDECGAPSETPSKKVPGRTRVGERKPARDPVGGGRQNVA